MRCTGYGMPTERQDTLTFRPRKSTGSGTLLFHMMLGIQPLGGMCRTSFAVE
jgi:hypothetical protein